MQACAGRSPPWLTHRPRVSHSPSALSLALDGRVCQRRGAQRRSVFQQARRALFAAPFADANIDAHDDWAHSAKLLVFKNRAKRRGARKYHDFKMLAEGPAAETNSP